MDDGPSPQTSTRAEGGSFRDWDGRVFRSDGRILRALTASGLADWDALSAAELFERFTASGNLVRTTRAGAEVLADLERADPAGEWVAALSHEPVPFVSYPYEWPFEMLKDAALLQLELTSAAVEQGLTLKDASPYNVQWHGTRPVFIDVGSFERARPGEAWAGYRQFCTLYLYPLLLEAHRGIPFQPWLRGSVDGIATANVREIFTWRDLLRAGVLRHVFLHAHLERRNAARDSDVRQELRDAGFNKRIVQANLEGLTRLVRRLRARERKSPWQTYDTTCTYDDADRSAKEDFVRRVVTARRRHLVWDLGCNEGRHALIASQEAAFVVAVDSDRTVVQALYRTLRHDANHTILPLVVDLADPSPAIGWRNGERLTLIDRGRPDLALCLALVHHLSIARNIPLRELVDWLASLRCEVVVEFPARDDPMVQRLLRGKRGDAHPDYDRQTFEDLLAARFDIVESLELSSKTRTLHWARPR